MPEWQLGHWRSTTKVVPSPRPIPGAPARNDSGRFAHAPAPATLAGTAPPRCTTRAQGLCSHCHLLQNGAFPSSLFAGLAKSFHKALAVLVIGENVLSPVAAIHDACPAVAFGEG